jgi:uncharacterized protein (TIGR02594 family)
MTFPKRYEWLGNVGTLPKMVSEGLRWVGTLEAQGSVNNPVIMGWAAELGVARLGYKYVADSVPWCGLFMGIVALHAGKPVVEGPLYALNWSKFGTEAGQPVLGDVLTFSRQGGGHVALYIGEDATAYHVLGGNQSDSVSITPIDKKRLYRARRAPFSVALPTSARPYIIADSGMPYSVNEA